MHFSSLFGNLFWLRLYWLNDLVSLLNSMSTRTFCCFWRYQRKSLTSCNYGRYTFPSTPITIFATYPSPATGKRKRQDRWAQRANLRSRFNSVTLLEDDLMSTIQPSYVGALNDDDEEEIQISWPDTPDHTESSPQPHTPTLERRSQSSRKTSYASIFPRSKYNT